MRAFVGLAIALCIVSCGGADSPITVPASSKTYDVFTNGDSFGDVGHSIAPNDTVRWNFSGGSDGQGHNVRFSPRIVGSPSDIPIQKSGTASRVFTARGTFNYVCDVHPGMNGIIIVE
jgi:plastocyanin